jgi:tyrosinase
MALRIRKDAWSLPAWDPIFLWYARAIREMQQRPIADPTSWRYQAAVHDYVRNNDPYSSSSDILPAQAEQNRFWRQCQHFTWFFLPWHRMYLGHFEEMIRSIVISQGGPDDWALPYWNYSDKANPNARRLPQAFVDTETPDGTPNPLRVEAREAGNDGGEVGEETDVDVEACLTESEFEAALFGGAPGFGGPRTRFKHAPRPGEPTRFGSLEATPHGSMHVAVGGFTGWMSGFETAALDPIFWLHHCNIDRLWEVWLRRPPQQQGQFTNPTNAAWNTAVSFELHDAQGNEVTMMSSEVVNPATSIFTYEYDNTADPLAAPPPPLPPGGGILESMGERIPEMVGATDAAITLSGDRTTTRLSTSAPTGPALEAAGAPGRTILNVENITSEGRSPGYGVYINLPEGGNPAEHRELFAGNLPLFGIDAAENPNEPHPGDGLTYALDISKVVRVLQGRGQWDPKNIRLTFVPKRRPRALEAATPPVRVGRVSLYSA